MIKAILFDFSRVLLFPRDQSFSGRLNDLYQELLQKGEMNFFNTFVLNEDLISYLRKLKTKYQLFIFTTETIQADPAVEKILRPIFKQIFSAKELGLSKKDQGSYIKIATELNLKPAEVLFIDDSKENTEIAASCGYSVVKYVSNKQLFNDLSESLK